MHNKGSWTQPVAKYTRKRCPRRCPVTLLDVSPSSKHVSGFCHYVKFKADAVFFWIFVVIIAGLCAFFLILLLFHNPFVEVCGCKWQGVAASRPPQMFRSSF